MASSNPEPDPACDDRIGKILDEYFKLREPRPTVEEYAARFPELRDTIQEVLPTLAALQRNTHGEEHGGAQPHHIGGHRILRELGRGGMGIVYEAVQEPVGRHVALKILPTHAALDPGLLERFKREATAAAKLQHPNIVPVHEIGEADGISYFTMALIDGASLGSIVDQVRAARDGAATRRTGEAPAGFLIENAADSKSYFRDVARLGMDVADALAHAHGHGVLHRDVKPSNLLLDGDGKIWITDFGLCKAEGSESITRTGDFVGTLRYMAPERLDGQSDVRSDVYGLGVTLYELITLERAFSASTHVALSHQIQFEEPTRPSRLVKDLPRDLETIILKAMHKDPGQRYPTAEALGRDLRAFLEHRPIVAKAPTLGYVLRLTMRRHKAVSITLLVAILAGLVMNAFYIGKLELSGREQTRQRKSAEWQSYRSAVGGAEIALRSRDLDAARRSLALAPEPYRGWEWHHFQACLEESAIRLTDVTEVVRFSPDGRYLLSRKEFKPVLLDRSGNTIREFEGHRSWVKDLSFTDAGDRFVSASVDHTARIWSTETGETLHVLAGHTDEVLAAAFTQDGRHVATASKDFTVRLWDAGIGECLEILEGHSRGVSDVVFNGDGSQLASAGADSKIRIRRLDGSLAITLPGHTGPVLSVSFDPGGTRLASASEDRTVRIWDVQTGQEIHRLLGHEDIVNSVAFDPDGLIVASGSNDRTWRVWDATDGALLRTHLTSAINNLEISPDGMRVAVATQTWVQEYPTLVPEAVQFLHGSLERVTDLCFSPAGTPLASVGRDTLVRLWDSKAGLEVATLAGNTSRSMMIQYTPDGHLLIVSSRDGQISVWDTSTRTLQRTLPSPGGWARISASPDGRSLAASYSTGRVLLWDLDTGNQECVFSAEGDSISIVRFAPDGKRLILGHGETSMIVLDLETSLATEVAGHEDIAVDVAFSRDGTLMASASMDHTVRLWDSKTLRPLATLRGHSHPVLTVAFHPDGQRLASAGWGGVVKLWAIPDGDEMASLSCGRGWVQAIAFSPDGNQLAASSPARTITIWSVHRNAEDDAQFSAAARARLRARSLVSGLFDELGSEAEVRRELERRTLAPELRTAALALAATWKGRPGPYLDVARQILLDPERLRSDYQVARLRCVRLLSNSRPHEVWSGIRAEAERWRALASHRGGDPSAAIMLLGRASAANPGAEPTALDRAILSLAHGAAGDAEESRRHADALELQVTRDGEACIDASLLAEVRALPRPSVD